ncbi:N-acetylmuramoyl-L-alanine amidase [Termitidicoccus mucosus]|uniref:Peptidoglycan-binding protein n=1 Tax=Termitidicoccus mucosus TaxID=1184151 RepID=A0A178ID56_9BACT|nr:peptidoglycan-binding protein [Opitutaceae bacterium TSB47]
MTTRRAFLQTAGLALLGMGFAPAILLGAEERTYRIRKGDTLSSIAARHGISVAALKQRNQLKSDTIITGQRLIIPAAGVSAVPRSVAPVPALSGIIAATRSLKIQRGRWKYLVVHHSGIEAGNARAYNNAHRERGMEHGLAYHFVIGNGRDSGDGEIEIGPRWLKQLDGGHVRNHSYNQHGIGICLVGNFEKRRVGPAQLASMTMLLDWLRKDAPLGTRPSVTVHRWVDRNHTVCPGRYFPFDTIKKRYA